MRSVTPRMMTGMQVAFWKAGGNPGRPKGAWPGWSANSTGGRKRKQRRINFNEIGDSRTSAFNGRRS